MILLLTRNSGISSGPVVAISIAITALAMGAFLAAVQLGSLSSEKDDAEGHYAPCG